MATPVEIAALRMTRFLASVPRKQKTHDYLASMPRRERIVVTADDYAGLTKTEARQAGKTAERDAARYRLWEERGKPPSPPRIDRMRPRARPPAEPGLLLRLAEIQDFKCSLCGRELAFDTEPSDPARATVDHVTPLSLGGKNDGNRLACHLRCNNQKGNSPPTIGELSLLESVNEALSRTSTRPSEQSA